MTTHRQEVVPKAFKWVFPSRVAAGLVSAVRPKWLADVHICHCFVGGKPPGQPRQLRGARGRTPRTNHPFGGGQPQTRGSQEVKR